MTGFKAMCIAFSIYSKIPVPIFRWEEKEMRYQLIFFPWIGAVIGAMMVGWNYLAERFQLGAFSYVFIAAVLPIVITGGFHIDGYMDTMDALHSYQPKEEKLKILKDPHIGAFSVIMLGMLGMIYLAAISELNRSSFISFAGAFFVARCLSGLTVILFPSAKEDGMLHTFSSAVKGRGNFLVFGMLIIQLVLGVVYMIFMKPVTGVSMLVTISLFTAYYRYKTRKEFGGITGDTAGWFVTAGETIMAVAAAVSCVVC